MSDPAARRPDGMPVGKPFPKGVSGNPGGGHRVKKLKLKLREYDKEAEEALMKQVRSGDVRALQIFFAYRHGLPVRPIEIAGNKGKPLTVQHEVHDIAADRLAEVVRVLERAGVLPAECGPIAALPAPSAEADSVYSASTDAAADSLSSFELP